MKRREFLVLTAAGVTSAAALTACGHPENKLIPAFIPDEQSIPGIDTWKASVCGLCPAGCGIVVRTREHKASKIEGNPLHPLNRGGLCARGQAGLQVLYNPDRARGPMKRTGDRGAGQYVEIGWDEALQTLATKLREIKSAHRSGSIVFAAGRSDGITAHAAGWFLSSLGSNALFDLSPHADTQALAGYEQSYGSANVPTFDLARSRYVLSFGARFLETWNAPVMYSAAFGEFRGAADRPRGKFVQVEPRMSLTGANADQWLPASPGSEGLLALSIAHVIAREKLLPNASKITIPDQFAPEQTAAATNIPAGKVVRIAREFAFMQPAVAIAGGEMALPSAFGRLPSAAGAEQLNAVHLLNLLAGSVGKPGGVLLAPARSAAPRADGARAFQQKLEKQEIAALMVHGANPVYSAPALRDKIASIPFIVSFSSMADDTSALADLILPDHSFLERWDARLFDALEVDASGRAGHRPAIAISQPVLQPEFNTRQTADALIALAQNMGDAISSPPPFESAEALANQLASRWIAANHAGKEESADDALAKLLEQGVRTGEFQPARAFSISDKLLAERAAKVTAALAVQPSEQNTDERFPLVLFSYEHQALGHGSLAHVPWLQELPDPMTSVMWGSWIEINPKTAASMGIADGDLVEVRSPFGSVRAPAVVYPAIRPDVVAMPGGQGHVSYGRYASGRGANPAHLFAPELLENSNAALVRVSIAKVSRESGLVRFGTTLPEKPELHR